MASLKEWGGIRPRGYTPQRGPLGGGFGGIAWRTALSSFILSGLLSGCRTYSELSTASTTQIATTRAVLTSRLGPHNDETWVEEPGAELPLHRADGVLRLTEDQVVALGLGESRQFAASKATVDAARAEEPDALTVDNLELRAERIHQQEVGGTTASMDYALRVRPPHLLEQTAQADVARAVTLGVEAEVEVARLEVACALRRVFGEVRLLDAELEVSRLIVDARQKLLALAVERAARGAAVQLDASMAELSLEEARQEGLELEERRHQALAALTDRLGLPHNTRLELVYAPLEVPLAPLPSENALIELALARRPELRVAAAKRDVSAAETRLARSLLVPSLSFLQLGYELDPQLSGEQYQSWSLSAGVEVPIPGFNRAETRTARARESVSIHALNAEVERTVLAVRDGLRRLQGARKALELYRAGPVAASERAGREIARALEAGQADLVRVTLLEERNAEIRQRLVQHQRDYFEALGALHRQVGGELPPP